jgi:hypothetical protein
MHVRNTNVCEWTFLLSIFRETFMRTLDDKPESLRTDHCCQR